MVAAKAKAQRLSPGLVALVLVAVLAFSLSFSLDRERSVLEDAYDSVAVVVCGNSYGTGWWINDNTMITAFHVVQSCIGSNVTVVRSPWSGVGRVIAYDPELDVAAIRIEKPHWIRALPLARTIGIGDEAYVVGYPIQLYEETQHDVEKMSEIPRVNKVIVTWLNPERKVFEFSPGTDAGNSGGPIVSIEQGGVAGIVIYARRGVVTEGFYGLRADALVEFFRENGIEYRVASFHGIAFYAGLGFVLVLLFIVAREKGVVKI